MSLPYSRNTTYAVSSQVKSADLNAVQDQIIAHSKAVAVGRAMSAIQVLTSYTHNAGASAKVVACSSTGTIVLAGSNGGARVAAAYSTDGGRTFSLTGAMGNGSSGTATRAVYGGGKFVVGTSAGKIEYSTDGNTWSEVSIAASAVRSLAYGNSLYTLALANGAVYTSSDAITWTLRATNTNIILWSLLWSSNLSLWIGGGSNSSSSKGVIYTSPDAITWTLRHTASSAAQIDVTEGREKVIGVCVSSTRQDVQSTDGITWSTNTMMMGAAAAFSPQCVIFCSELGVFFMAEDASDFLCVSVDGTNFFPARAAAPASADRMAWEPKTGRLVIVIGSATDITLSECAGQ